MSKSDDWRNVAKAAAELGKTRDTVYQYLRRPEVETGIRRMLVGESKVTMVHMPSLRAYEATRKPGRPRKS